MQLVSLFVLCLGFQPLHALIASPLCPRWACPASQSLHMTAAGPKLKARLIGTGSSAPVAVISNEAMESIVETSADWISTRTGISKRRVLDNSGCVSSLGSEAAKKALESSGVAPEDIELVIVASSSPDDLFGDATTVAASIGAHNAVAFDLTAACSGFLFGVVTASQFLTTGFYDKCLVVGADALSRWVDWDDRNTCILFGDGAGAMVMEAVADEADSGVLGSSMHSDGRGHGKLALGYSGTERDLGDNGDLPYSSYLAVFTDHCCASAAGGFQVSSGGYQPISMNGREVYKFATREVPAVLREALDAAGMEAEQVDWLLLHQANIRIMEAVAQRLGIPMEKVITNLSEYGNTSAASIPLALDEAVRSGKVKKGDVVACAGFGAGLSWGAAILKWG
ncbi:unnamed protein product [Chrysoparadoxa australica]